MCAAAAPPTMLPPTTMSVHNSEVAHDHMRAEEGGGIWEGGIAPEGAGRGGARRMITVLSMVMVRDPMGDDAGFHKRDRGRKRE